MLALIIGGEASRVRRGCCAEDLFNPVDPGPRKRQPEATRAVRGRAAAAMMTRAPGSPPPASGLAAQRPWRIPPPRQFREPARRTRMTRMSRWVRRERPCGQPAPSWSARGAGRRGTRECGAAPSRVRSHPAVGDDGAGPGGCHGDVEFWAGRGLDARWLGSARPRRW